MNLSSAFRHWGGHTIWYALFPMARVPRHCSLEPALASSSRRLLRLDAAPGDLMTGLTAAPFDFATAIAGGGPALLHELRTLAAHHPTPFAGTSIEVR